MAIRRLNGRNKFANRDRITDTVSTLPTVKAMRGCFEKYLNLTIADGNASSDTIKTYRSRVRVFLAWCKERELYPALITQENVKEGESRDTCKIVQHLPQSLTLVDFQKSLLAG